MSTLEQSAPALLELITWLEELIGIEDEELIAILLELTGAIDEETATLLETASLLATDELAGADELEGVVEPVHATVNAAAMITGSA